MSKCVSIIFKARELVAKDASIILYSLFLPHLNYCCKVWANTYKTNLHKIGLLQERVFRIIHRVDKYFHTSVLFLEMVSVKWLDMVKFKSLLTMFKAYHNGFPNKLQSYFTVDSEVNIFYNTRSIDTFKIKTCKNTPEI